MRPWNPSSLDKSDSYKDSHDAMMPDGVTESGLYYEARGGEMDFSCLYGLQYTMIAHMEGEFVTQKMLDEQVNDVIPEHMGKTFPYNKRMWQHIIDKYQGRLPVEIRAVEEGLPIPTGNALFTIRNLGGEITKSLPGWLEGLLEQTWYGSGVFSRSRTVKLIIKEYLDLTADKDETGNYPSLDYQLQDFGFRGATSIESAGIGGSAHLFNFRGTDTKLGMSLLHDYYKAPRVTGKSVGASEHSVMTIRGRNGESIAVGAILDKFPDQIVSIVGDSYDIYNFTDNIIGKEYHSKIQNRIGKVVVRPDSGNPSIIVPRLLESLGAAFGFTMNSKGYKVLVPTVGLLWGDGMNMFSIRSLLKAVMDAGWSAENIVVGMGSGLLQKIDRDTQKVAIKMCYAIINGELVEVYKEPITDPGKTSKKGKLATVYINGNYRTVNDNYGTGVPFDILQQVFNMGEVTRIMAYDRILKNAALAA